MYVYINTNRSLFVLHLDLPQRIIIKTVKKEENKKHDIILKDIAQFLF